MRGCIATGSHLGPEQPAGRPSFVVEHHGHDQANDNPADGAERAPADVFPEPAEAAVIACVQGACLARLNFPAGTAGAGCAESGVAYAAHEVRGGLLGALGTDFEGCF